MSRLIRNRALTSNRERSVRRSPFLPDQRGLSLMQKAQSLADYLTAAALAGYLEECVTHAKLMLANVIATEDEERLWYAGHRIEWRRGAPDRAPRYIVCAYEHAIDAERIGAQGVARKPRDYKAEYARRIRRALARGRTVQEARGHAKGDRGKVETRKRGTKVVPIRETVLFPRGTQLPSAEAFNFAGREEGVVLAEVRTYADAEIARQKRRRAHNREVLLFRFRYRDIKYADAARRDGDDGWATTSGYNVYFDWSRFLLDYNVIKARSIDGKIGQVLFGYSG